MARDPGRSPVPGEYSFVCRASRDVEALGRAHATPIDRVAAERMLRDLAREHLPEAEAAALVIRWGSRGGRGGRLAIRERVARVYTDGRPVLHWRTGKPRYRMKYTGRSVPYVSLPSTPLAEAGVWWGERVTRTGRKVSGSRLRVGLVLHEFAHVLRPRAYHGPEFVAALDQLVAAWHASCSSRTPEATPADAILGLTPVEA